MTDKHAEKLAHATDKIAEKIIRTHGVAEKSKGPGNAEPPKMEGSIMLGVLANKTMNKTANHTGNSAVHDGLLEKDGLQLKTVVPKLVNGGLQHETVRPKPVNGTL